MICILTVVLTLLLVPRFALAQTLVQFYGADCVGSATCTNTIGFGAGPTTPGDLEVCGISVTASPDIPTPTIVGITGDIIPAGWTKAGSVAQGSGSTYIDTEIWYGIATGASNANTAINVTITTATANAEVNCAEYSGSGAIIDIPAVVSTGIGFIATTANYTTTNAKDVLFAAVGRAGYLGVSAASGGFSLAGIRTSNPGTCSGSSPCPNAGMTYYRLPNAIGTYSTGNATNFASSANWGTVLVGFKQAPTYYFR